MMTWRPVFATIGIFGVLLPVPAWAAVPSAVTNLTAATSSQIGLTWTSPTNILSAASPSYDIRYSTTGPIITAADFSTATAISGGPVPSASGTMEYLTLTGLKPRITYWWAIRSSNASGTSTEDTSLPEPNALAGSFVLAQEPAGATGPAEGAVAWGDYDNDGDLDLAVNGTDGGGGRRFRVYRNDGGTFVLAQEPAGVEGPGDWGAVAWGDYDNDGDLDLAVNGWDSSGYHFRVYRNDGGTFVLAQEPAGATGPGRYGAVAWGDYDNDGDLDLAVTGADGPNRRFRVYRNDGGTFVLAQEPAGVTGPGSGAVAWGDYDNDGDLDLAVNGHDGVAERFRVYRNDGGTFVLAQEPAGATGPASGTVAWGDYDNDGDLDLAVNGSDGAGWRFRVYRNDGGTFVLAQEPAGANGPADGAVAWGDYDNDGDLDLAVTGYDGVDYRFRVYRNDGGTFVLAQEPAGTTGPGYYGTVAWGDYDNDGDLDLVVNGLDAAISFPSSFRFRVYKSLEADFYGANTAPSAPSAGFATSRDTAAASVTLKWNAGNDSGPGPTPANGLYYNVRVSTQSGVYTSSPSLKVSWLPATPFIGNYAHGYVSSSAAQLGLIYKPGVAAATFYWQVASVDTGLRQSPWSVEQSTFVDFRPPAVPTSIGAADVPGDQGFALRISWTANSESDLRDYGIHRATYSGAGTSPAPTRVMSPGTTHQDGGLTNGTTYYYRLTARDTNLNESAGSTQVSSIPYDNLVPGAPTGLGAGNPGTGGVLRLSWTANTEADLKDYGVYRATMTGGADAAPARILTPGTTHQPAGLTNGVTYYFRLTARDVSLNESGYSTEVSSIPYDTPPPAPTGLWVSNPGTSGRLTLAWVASTEADLKDYGIYRATYFDTFSTKALVTRILAPGTTFEDAALANGTTYYYQMTARDLMGQESGGNGHPRSRTKTWVAQSPSSASVAGNWAPAGAPWCEDVLFFTPVAPYDCNLDIPAAGSFTGEGSPGAGIYPIGGVTLSGGFSVGGGWGVSTAYGGIAAGGDYTNCQVWATPNSDPSPFPPVGLGAANSGMGGRLNLSWTANTEGDLKDYRLYRRQTSGSLDGKVLVVVMAAPGTTRQDGGLTNGTTYYYQLTARDTGLNESGGSSEVAAIPYDTAAPSVPAAPAAADVPSDQGFALRLNWTANTEADLKDYGVYRATMTGALGTKALLTRVVTPGTTHQDGGGLTNGTSYYYQLTARDTSLNESGGSAEASAFPSDNLAPSAPTGVGVANPGTGGRLSVSWTANTEGDLKDYRVWRSTNTGVTLVSSHTVATVAAPGTTHQDGGLINVTTYYYRLTARDVSLNESGLGSEVSGTPTDVTAPTTPTGLTVADVPSDQGGALRLNWTANTEADLKDYRVWRGLSSGGLGAKSVVTTIVAPGTTQQDGGLVNGTSYFYQLMARDTSLNESGGSTEANAVPQDNLAPGAPTGVGVGDVPADQGGALRLSWTANTEGDLKDYGVYRALASGPLGTKTLMTRVNQPGTTHQDAGLTNGTNYYYQITARDVSLNESAGSTESFAAPADNVAPGVPAGLGVSNTAGGASAGGRLTLSWSANTESDLKDYRVRRSTGTGITAATAVQATIVTPGTTHQDAGLANNTTYYYRLTSRDVSLNESAISASDVGTYPADTLAPAAPIGFSVSGATNMVNVSWVANGESDLADYRLFRSTLTSALGAKTVAATVLAPGTTHRDVGLTNEVTYYYQLTARDGAGNESGGSTELSALPSSASDTTPPAIPTGLGVANSGPGGALRLSWLANTEGDLKDYGVYRSTAASQAATAATRRTYVAQPGTTHQDVGLVNGTTYYYRLTARDMNLNESGGSSEVSGSPTDTTPPANPVGLGAADVPSDQGGAIRLSWTANTEADLKDYRVWRGLSSGGLGIKSVVTTIAAPGTTHQDGGLGNGTTYYYQVTARDTSLNESAGGSAEASSVPYDNLAPSAPTGLGVVNPGTGGLNLSWTANTEGDLKDYGVYRATFAGTLATKALRARIAQPGTTQQDGALGNGTSYYYQVTARDVSLNESGGSTEVSGVPSPSGDTTPPAAPAGLGISNIAGGATAGGRISLSWTANTEFDLKDYGVYRATWAGASPGPTPARIMAPGTTHQSAGLTDGTTFYFRVTARDVSLNESGYSTEVSGFPADGPPAAPTGVSVSNPGTGGQLSLLWTTNFEADLFDYGVYRGAASGGLGAKTLLARVPAGAPGVMARQDAGLTNGATYYYQVTARDAALNESGGSSEVFAAPVVLGAVAAGTTVTVSGSGSQTFQVGGGTVAVSFTGLPAVSVSFSTTGVFNMGGLNMAQVPAAGATIRLPTVAMTIPQGLFGATTTPFSLSVSTNPLTNPINPAVPALITQANSLQNGNAGMPQPVEDTTTEIDWFDAVGKALEQGHFKKQVEVRIKYPDANDDRRVDRTKGKIYPPWYPSQDIEADDYHMIGCILISAFSTRGLKAAQWSDPFPTRIDTTNKEMVFKAHHFSIFTIMVTAPAPNLDGLVVYPVPYNPTTETLAGWDPAINGTLKFQGLSQDATIRLYTVTGERVREMLPGLTGKSYNSSTLNSRAEWDGTNEDGEGVARGLYFWVVEDPAGGRKRGKILVLR